MFSVVAKNKKGFTLIELLVVIAIIGLLATLSIVALNSARMKGRDAKRKADIKQIYNALQMYYDEHGKYPPGGGYGVNTFVYSVNENWLSDLAPWMSKRPVDPINNNTRPFVDGSYTYIYGDVTADGQGFTLITQLENKNDPDRCELKGYRRLGLTYFNTSWCGSPSNYSKYIYSPQ